jgi:hypothetical protein
MEKFKTKFEFVTLPLTAKIKGSIQVPQSSGLNWGQRPGREQNQAYLPVPSYIQKSHFFPEPGILFNIECDDGKIFRCIRAQANGKAIHTPENNSLFGFYFRSRLKILPGYAIKIVHLINYGRSSVDIFKNSNTGYYLDFSISEK